jgi:hypothetical protein
LIKEDQIEAKRLTFLKESFDPFHQDGCDLSPLGFLVLRACFIHRQQTDDDHEHDQEILRLGVFPLSSSSSL